MSIKITTTRPRKRTKIVATLGPTSANEQTLRQMIYAGLDVVRINFSQGTEHMVNIAFESVINQGMASPGDLIVITAGTPYGPAGRTNLLKIEEIPVRFAEPKAV